MISDVGIKQIESEGRGLDLSEILASKTKKVYGMVSLTLQKSVWLSPTPYPPPPAPVPTPMMIEFLEYYCYQNSFYMKKGRRIYLKLRMVPFLELRIQVNVNL